MTLAERTGLIVPMEGWLLEGALAQLGAWRKVRPDFHISINLSGRQLEQPDFLEVLAARIEASGVPPESIQLEVTETFAMERSEDKSKLLHRIAELGVTLAVDDFGTGYSNLGHLQHLPFGVVKIDRSFMHNVPEDQRNFALVRTIIAMAQSLELEIIAEGVETNTQADFLYWEGATLLQGFHFGEPIPAELFTSRHVKLSN
jgi:EAL domain-containing protein (putative c-di-GMP-specific phosphodiesterase class I)